MKTQRILTALFLEITLVLGNVATVHAGPPIQPSSFWGTVQVDEANVSDGTTVQALIGGQVFASATTTVYGGLSYYTFDVRGDDPDTPAKDGGVEGDTIQFQVDGLVAAQTSVWHSGTNVQLNLTAVNVYELTVSRTGAGSGTVTSSPAGINCGTDCSESFNYNTLVTLTAAAVAGSTFAGWSGDGCSGTGTCQVTMNTARSIVAEFTQDQYTLTVTSDHGTVTKDPDQATYTYGQVVHLTATPATGWSFVNWTGDVNSSNNPVTITINANKAITANYSEQPTPVTITVDSGQSKVYGADDPIFTYTSSVSGVTFTGALSRVAGENVGTYAITQGDLEAVGNYVITFVPADFSITPKSVTVTADAKSKAYGTADPAFTYTSSVSGVPFTGVLSRDPGESVGTYAIIQGTLSAGSNYVITFVSADLTITPKSVTVTADAKSKVYGTADPALTYTSSDSSATFTGVLSRDPGESVGDYAIRQGTLSAGSNYTIVFISADLTITPKSVTVTADAKSKVYGTADPVFTYNSSVNGVPFTGTLSRVAGENVGSYAITQGTLSAGSNYAITFVSSNLTITPKSITVTADTKSKVFGAADPALTYTSSESGVPFTGALSRDPGESVGTYAITQGTLSAGSNYAITFISADFIIAPMSITVTADAKSKVYGTADPVFTYTASDSGVTLTGALSRVAGEDVGSYTITQGTLSAGSDYAITFIPANLTITPAAMTITAENKSKTYGVANPVLTATYSGFVNGDDQADLDTPVTLSTLADVSSLPGTYTINASAAADVNYTITFVNGILSVTPASFALTSPTNGAINQLTSLTLSWQASTGAVGYEYCYDTTGNGSCDGSWTSAGTDTSATISGLNTETTYFWLVRATHSAGTTDANGGIWWSFITVPEVPAAFGKTSPANGVTGQSVSSTLTWEASVNVNFYEYCYDTTNDNACSTWVSTGSSTSKTLDGLNPNTTYYWQVRAVNPVSTIYADGSDTAFWSFTTGTLPSAFKKKAPANKAIKQPVDPTLKWGTSANATSYEYCYDTTNNNVCDSSWTSVGTTSVSLSGLTNDTTYYWQVRAVGMGGYTYANSGAWFNFKVIIAAPELFTPEDGTLTHNRRPFFDWAGVSGATGYTIEVSTVPSFATKAFSANVVASNYTRTSDLTANKLFYWRVRAKGKNGPSAYSVVRTFTTGNATPVPVLTFPATNTLFTTSTVKLDWKDVVMSKGPGFDHYEIEVANDAKFTTGIFTDTTGVSEYLFPVTPNTRYYWHVRTYNQNGDYSAWSASRVFRAAMLPPNSLAPGNVIPDAADSIHTRRPTYTWDSVAGATKYTIQVSTFSNFTSTVMNVNVTDSNYIHTADLAANTVYYWRVRANGANGPSPYSAVRTFTTGNPPSIPSLSSPANKALLGSTTVLFNWGNSKVPKGTAQFDHYQIQVSASNTFTSILVDENTNIGNVNDSEYLSTSELSNGITYYWRVRSWNDAGDFSTWSAVRSVRVKYLPPDLLSPANATTDVSRKPTFDWNDTADATSYTLQVSTSSKFLILTVNKTLTASTYVQSAKLAANKTYYWRVRVNGPNGPSDWSPVFSFTTSP